MKLSRKFAVVLAILAPLTLGAGTNDVFRVQTTLKGVIQNGTLINKVFISDEDLVNLAQSRTLGTPVPKNEILALVNACPSNELRLIVFDTTAASNLVTIGSFSNLTTAVSAKRRYMETMTLLTINDISTADTNGVLRGITGGSFYYHGKNNVATNGCPTSFGGQFTGFLGTTFAQTCFSNIVSSITTNCILSNCVSNCVVECSICETNDCRTTLTTNLMQVTFPCSLPINVIIPRSPITTGKAIGTLIEEDPQPE